MTAAGTADKSARRPFLRALVLAAALGLSGCVAISRDVGFVPSEQDLAEIAVGLDTRSTVDSILGAPTLEGIRDDSGWYYVRSQIVQRGWTAPVETDREVVAVSFDARGVVSNVERFGLQDGQVVPLSRRVTDSNTRGIGFLRQAFGNLGRIDAANFLR